MNIISNLKFKFCESANQHGATPRSGPLNAKSMFKGTSRPIISARIDRLVNALQLRRWRFSHKETL